MRMCIGLGIDMQEFWDTGSPILSHSICRHMCHCCTTWRHKPTTKHAQTSGARWFAALRGTGGNVFTMAGNSRPLFELATTSCSSSEELLRRQCWNHFMMVSSVPVVLCAYVPDVPVSLCVRCQCACDSLPVILCDTHAFPSTG